MAKLPPNPYDVGPPDPPVVHCDICYGDVDDPGEWFGCRCPECPVCGHSGLRDCFSNGHMSLNDMPKPYGLIFYESMIAEVNSNSPLPAGIPIRLAPWNQLDRWEQEAIHVSVMKAIKEFRDKEVFHNE